MKPHWWFSFAAAFFGAAVACLESGVKAYANDDRWDKALATETKVPNGVPRET